MNKILLIIIFKFFNIYKNYLFLIKKKKKRRKKYIIIIIIDHNKSIFYNSTEKEY